MNTGKRSVKQRAKTGGRRVRPWLERLARLGFLAKGLVYATVGALALQAAFGVGGQTTDTQGAVAVLARAPFGRALLVVLSVGLVAYGLWRFVQAGTNPGGRSGAAGVVARAGFAASGVVHLALAATAVGLLIGSSGGGGNTEQDLTARLLTAPLGRVLSGLVGLATAGAGVFGLVKAYRADFRRALRTAEMSAAEQMWAVRAGRAGYAARGLVFTLVGVFFGQAALQSQPYGPLLLGGVALGLVLYGVYTVVEARYRNIYAE